MEQRFEKLTDDQRNSLITELEDEARNPMAGNAVFAALARTLRDRLLNDDDELGLQLEDSLSMRLQARPMSQGHLVQFLNRVFQHRALTNELHGYSYPVDFESDEVWERFINFIATNPDTVWDLNEDLVVREVQTNKSDRYKTFKLVAQMYEKRLGRKPRILDVGCSLNLGLKQLGNSVSFPFKPVEFNAGGYVDERSTLSANTLLAARFAIGKSTGVDIINPATDRDWVRSCSFYPKELLVPRAVMEFDDLVSHDDPNISFARFDFTDDVKFEDFSKAIGKQKFDMVTFSTIWYLLSAYGRKKMLDRAKMVLSDEGIIVGNDFMYMRSSSNDGMAVHENIKGKPYRTVVIDPSSENNKAQEIFVWENGRPTNGELGSGEIVINHKRMTVRQAIEQAADRLPGQSTKL